MRKRMGRTARLLAAGTALVCVPGLASAQDCTTNARRVVDAIYQQVLQRPSNGEESSTAVAQLSRGEASVRELVRNMAKSQEHRQRFLAGVGTPALNNATAYLYRHLLGREPDPGGLQSHAKALARGDVEAVVDSMMDSTEYQQSFGDHTVPGSWVRYCGADGSVSSRVGRSFGEDDEAEPSRSERFETLDTNGSGRIERSEWRGSADAFEWLDRNRDNVLSRAEVVGGRSGQGDSFSSRSGQGDSFSSLDADRSGTLDLDEWRWSRQSFDRADVNGDGVVTRREFTQSGGAPAPQGR